MPDEQVPENSESTTEIRDLDDAFAAARADMEAAESSQEATSEEEAPSAEEEETTEEVEASADDDEESASDEQEETAGDADELPEHMAWIRKVDGMVDKETGELDVDKLALAAYNLNSQNQSVLNRLQQLAPILQRPEVQAIIQQAGSGKPADKPSAKDDEPEQKSAEDILREFVRKEFEEVMAPIEKTLSIQRARMIQDETQRAVQSAAEQLGTDTEGNPLFAQGSPLFNRVDQQLQQIASSNRVQPNELIAHLAEQGTLENALVTIAKQLAFDDLRKAQLRQSKQQQKKKASTEKKKKANLTRSTDSPVTPSETDMDLDDILEASMNEIKAGAAG